MPKLKELIKQEEELDRSFLESQEYAKLSQEAFKKTYGMLKGWKRTGQEVKDRARRTLYD
ncbi:MAG: hypothetical protein AABX70_01880 [Nanoarchaeota archaeon]